MWFSEPVTGFTAADVVVTGSATPSTVEVLGEGGSYRVVVGGVVGAGTVTVTVPAGVAIDAAGNGNRAAPTEASVEFAVVTSPLSLGGLAPVQQSADAGRSGAVVTYPLPTFSVGSGLRGVPAGARVVLPSRAPPP